MGEYEMLLMEAEHDGVCVREKRFRSKAKGLCKGNVIGISSAIHTLAEKTCVLAEELGHYHTTVGDILDQSSSPARKQERRAREWAFNRLIPLRLIVDAHHARLRGRHEIADYLCVTEAFLQSSIDRYLDKFGLFAVVDNRYVVLFDPLNVIDLW